MPLTLGLFLANPFALMVGRVVGVALLTVSKRRLPPLKTTFNLALMVGETGVAVAVFAAITSLADGLGPVSWLRRWPPPSSATSSAVSPSTSSSRPTRAAPGCAAWCCARPAAR